MASQRFEVQGLDELGKNLAGLDALVRDKLARRAVAAAASIVRKAARANAPVDTGNLQKAIIMKRQRRTALTEAYTVGVRQGKTKDVKDAKKGRGQLGKDAYYYRFVEFGTVKQAPQPFLGPALAENVEPATTKMKDVLFQGIEKLK